MLDLSHLNSPQLEAVRTRTGPLLVLAGAGTGKTRVITYRIAYLIEKGTPPEGILAVTFTNKAAREMRDRVKTLLRNKKLEKQPTVCTIHSFCARLLREEHEAAGLPPGYTIMDSSDQQSLIAGFARECGLDDKKWPPRLILHAIGNAKNRKESLALLDEDLREVFRKYQVALRDMGSVDFDDLLLKADKLLSKNKDVAKRLQERYSHTLVDEFQDTNRMQFDIIRNVVGSKQNLCVVGDDDQSIYGWRGAEPGNILKFDQYYPKAKIVRLEENYRSSPIILEAANAVISENRDRHPKALWTQRADGEPIEIIEAEDDRDEARLVVERALEILKLEKRPTGDAAILFRTNAQSRLFEEQLRLRQVRYVLIGGMRFYDRREVKDILSYFRYIVNRDDETALLRILNYPPRGIGKTTIDKIDDFARKKSWPLWRAMDNMEHIEGLSDKARGAVEKFENLIGRYRERMAAGDLVAAARGLIGEIGLKETLAKTAKSESEGVMRIENAESVVDSLAAYARDEAKPTLSGFLEAAALMNNEEEEVEEPEKNALTLLTLHSGKGLEFPVVFLTGIEEGLTPHERSVTDSEIDEERRLFYVGITRAKDRLIISLCLSRSRFGSSYPKEPSRFLESLPDHLVDRMEWEKMQDSREKARMKAASFYLDKMNSLFRDAEGE